MKHGVAVLLGMFMLFAGAAGSGVFIHAQTAAPFPGEQLKFGMFIAHFGSDGRFTIDGRDWPSLRGTWRTNGAEIELTGSEGAGGCDGLARYGFRAEGNRVRFSLISDDCMSRRLVLDQSSWIPAQDTKTIPDRRILRTIVDRAPLRLNPGASAGSWPSFRGPQASGAADDQHLPDAWDVQTGKNILWRTSIPGLAHSSPIVWGNRIFVTSAISSNPNATFRPGLYGDGDSSDDRSRHRFMLYAIDKRNGKIIWERVAYEGAPVDKRHIKSTYASSTPATDGRFVIAWFGSQGVYAYDVNGNLRWKVDLGHLDLGAYNIPTLEWGPASSPIIWNGLVILQCDTHADSFIAALNIENGDIVWKTERNELPSWGTPTVAMTSKGPELVTNASNFIRGYDPRTGKELWRLGRSSLITAPTPVFAGELFVIASGRAPERPIFVVRAGARGDLTLSVDQTHSDAIVWSRSGRGSYMPTPLIYRDIVYVLNNNGVLDAYNLRTGEELYRERSPEIGSGFSASPVAADGKIYLANEDGEIIVIAAGAPFRHIATNSMGELLMATPALAESVMFVRTSGSVFAIGRKR